MKTKKKIESNSSLSILLAYVMMTMSCLLVPINIDWKHFAIFKKCKMSFK